MKDKETRFGAYSYISAFRKLQQEDCWLKASFGYPVNKQTRSSKAGISAYGQRNEQCQMGRCLRKTIKCFLRPTETLDTQLFPCCSNSTCLCRLFKDLSVFQSYLVCFYYSTTALQRAACKTQSLGGTQRRVQPRRECSNLLNNERMHKQKIYMQHIYIACGLSKLSVSTLKISFQEANKKTYYK